MSDITRNEELIMLSIWRLRDNAYGITIRKNMMEITKKQLHYGALYNMLYQLVRKGYLATQKSESRAEKGGRSKVLYFLTPAGMKALKEAQAINKLAWNNIPDFAYEGD